MIGEFDAGSIIDFKFSTRGTNGAGITFSGSPSLAVYKSNSLIQSTSGIALTVDFDSVTGLNHVRIDTSTDEIFYADGNDYQIVVTSGTVDSVSVVGEVIESFSIRNRSFLKPSVAGRTVDVDGAGLVSSSVAALTDGVITAAKFAADALTANVLSSDAVLEIQSGLATQLSLDTLQTSADAIDTDVNSLLSRLTALRAGYLDNLNIGGIVASQADALSIQNNTKAVRSVPTIIERPDNGTLALRIELLLYDSVGNMEVPDSVPSLDVANQSGTSRNDHLDSTSMQLMSTGRYRAIYTVQTADVLENLYFTFSVTEGGATRQYQNVSTVVDTTAVDFTSSDRTKLNTLASDYTTVRATKLDYLTGSVALNSDMATLLTRITGVIALESTLTAMKGAGWSNETLKAIYDQVILRLLSSDYISPDNTGINNIKAVTDRINAMLEVDGPVYRYTANALEQAPSGGGSVGFTLQDILTGIINDHGSGLYTSSDSSGSNTVNITIDDGTTPLPDVLVTVFGSDGIAIIDQKRTNNSGIASFALDAGDYVVNISSINGFSSLAAQDLTISANPQNVTYSLDRVNYLTPSSDSVRTVYGYIKNVGFSSVADQAVVAALSNSDLSVIDNAVIAHQNSQAISDNNGFWQLLLIKSSAFSKGDGLYTITIGNDVLGPFAVTDGDTAINVSELLTT